jgi:DNA/RNA-binding domain of Phe-tRNA-synthetase-like protein
MLLSPSPTLRTLYPGACAGALALRGVTNPAQHPALEAAKAALVERLSARYAGLDRAALAATPPLPAYAAYYKRFGQTYHVLRQIESVVHKGRPLPSVAALVEAMFMAELENGLLTAGHDLDQLAGPLRLDAAQGGETYLTLRGAEAALRPGDMFMADALGIVSSILSGPDARTQITPATTAALFAVYAPAGIGAVAVRAHLHTLEGYVRRVAPGAEQVAIDVAGA